MGESRYVSVHQNSIGSHWTTEHDSVREFRAFLLKDPEVRWAVLMMAGSGKVVESYTRPAARARKAEGGGG